MIRRTVPKRHKPHIFRKNGEWRIWRCDRQSLNFAADAWVYER